MHQAIYDLLREKNLPASRNPAVRKSFDEVWRIISVRYKAASASPTKKHSARSVNRPKVQSPPEQCRNSGKLRASRKSEAVAERRSAETPPDAQRMTWRGR